MGFNALAVSTNSLGVKYLAVLVFIMSPKAVSSFTLSIQFVCNLVHACVSACLPDVVCTRACVFSRLSCVCPAWHQPRSLAKLPISEAHSIKSPLTKHQPALEKHAESKTSSCEARQTRRRTRTRRQSDRFPTLALLIVALVTMGSTDLKLEPS